VDRRREGGESGVNGERAEKRSSKPTEEKLSPTTTHAFSGRIL